MVSTLLLRKHGKHRLTHAHSAFQSHASAGVATQICGITCCGRANFEQHRACKKHLRKAAIAAAAAADAGGGTGPIFEPGAGLEPERDRMTTYVGLQAQCRSYCKQVC